MSPFDEVLPPLARALAARGFETLTAVQEAVLAPHLQDADLLVSAQTGSGKTVAFGLNLGATLLAGAERLPPAGAPLALIIAPTRELAMQVRGELDWLYAQTAGRVVSCVGGMDMRDERRALDHGAHIVVGTPGRLVDHIRRGSLAMESLRAVVLDEADEMLNLGFREELEAILDAAPAERRTLMFSATMPRMIETLARKYQSGAVRVNTTGGTRQHADIAYRALPTAGGDVENAIFNVLRYHHAKNAIVFCGTRAAVTRLESRLSNRGLSVVALSGELSQSARTHALQALRDHRAQVCVATDVAARGIDLPDLELVIHADLPKNTEALLHRSGRTGRAGRKGMSVLVMPYSARRRAERLLQDAGVRAEWSDPPSAEDVRRRDDERLLGDPLLGDAPSEAEAAAVRALLERYEPAQIAAGFIRLHRKGQAAPEDIARAPSGSPGGSMGGSAGGAPRGERGESAGGHEGFASGAWVKLSVGRSKQAEPRWIVPMLCKAGGLTKRQIGAIRIGDFETFVEIDADSIDDFLAHVGEGGKLEKAIRVVPAEGPPPEEQRRPRARPGAEGRGRDAREPRETREPREARAPESGRPDGKRPRPRAAASSARPDLPPRADGPRQGGEGAHAPRPKRQKWHPVD